MKPKKPWLRLSDADGTLFERFADAIGNDSRAVSALAAIALGGDVDVGTRAALAAVLAEAGRGAPPWSTVEQHGAARSTVEQRGAPLARLATRALLGSERARHFPEVVTHTSTELDTSRISVSSEKDKEDTDIVLEERSARAVPEAFTDPVPTRRPRPGKAQGVAAHPESLPPAHLAALWKDSGLEYTGRDVADSQAFPSWAQREGIRVAREAKKHGAYAVGVMRGKVRDREAKQEEPSLPVYRAPKQAPATPEERERAEKVQARIAEWARRHSHREQHPEEDTGT